MTKPQTKDREPDLLQGTVEPPKTAAKTKSKPKTTPKVMVEIPKNEVARIEPAAPVGVLAMLDRALKNPSIDPTKMRELFALYQETEAKQQFHEALVSIDFPEIDRDGRIKVNGGKDLRFASFENVHRAVMPLLKKHGFRMSFAPMPGPNGEGMVVECRLIRGTYEEKCVVPMSTVAASRAMNAQQAIGAAIKYASRYGVMYLLNLRSDAPEDADTDGVVEKKNLRPAAGAAAEAEKDRIPPDAKISDEQKKMILKAIDECKVGPAMFLEKFGIDAVHELPAAKFDEAIQSCRNYAARVKEETARRAGAARG